ncbi:MAG TPA: hypothetical protein VF586_22095 [Pyrinomonadaceae bacterium]|jgi:hypothetical protein
MRNVFPSLLIITGGLVSVIFNKAASRLWLAWQRWLTGKEYDEFPMRLGSIIGGVSLIVTGALGLLGYLDIH